MLEVRSLDAWYGDSHILHGIDITVPASGRVAILGRNGAGKSTLLKSIMNGDPRVSGTVAWEGRKLADMPAFRRARLGLALVPEDRRIFGHITVAGRSPTAAVSKARQARNRLAPKRPPAPRAGAPATEST